MRSDVDSAQPIKIAILAMGGEGGGVLADWIVDLAEHDDWIAQTTSVPGVAQRTGATIYYVELYPASRARADGQRPVLALMPLPGDVDIVLASELMEAGRAVQRGLVTSDRTTLIASSHRVHSIAEKSAMGDGRVDSMRLSKLVDAAAFRFVRFDMAEVAEGAGSVISAVLFGALAGSGVLPFARSRFEATIERGGIGVKNSLTAFARAYERAEIGDDVRPASVATKPPAPRDPAVRALIERVRSGFPLASHDLLFEGVRRLIDYQDLAYAATYLDRMTAILALDVDDERRLFDATARHLALWMSYEDTARVADLKTRAARFERVRLEARATPDQVIAIDEYLHPRLAEVCESLPAGVGRWLMDSRRPRRLVERWTQRGRTVASSSLRGFLMLRLVASARRWRRSTGRFLREDALIEQWLLRIVEAARANPALALEIAECQRLVKGYSDTHERGLRNYEVVMAAAARAGAPLAPASLRALREAALADEHGNALRATLARLSLA